MSSTSPDSLTPPEKGSPLHSTHSTHSTRSTHSTQVATVQYKAVAEDASVTPAQEGEGGKPQTRPKDARFWLIFATLCCCCFLSAMDLTAVSTALPSSTSCPVPVTKSLTLTGVVFPRVQSPPSLNLPSSPGLGTSHRHIDGPRACLPRRGLGRTPES